VKKVQRLLAVLIGCVAISTLVSADGDVDVVRNKERRSYVRAGIGLPVYRQVGGGHFHSRPKLRISGSAAIGLRVNQRLTLELEGMYMKLSSKYTDSITPPLTSKMSYTTWAGFINCLFDFSQFQRSKFSPYIGVGVGFARNKTSNITNNSNSRIFSGDTMTQVPMQIIFGTDYSFNEHWSLNSDLRYIYWAKFRNTENTGVKLNGYLKTLSLNAAIKYSF
jgi:opacity protein-like surface antigen